MGGEDPSDVRMRSGPRSGADEKLVDARADLLAERLRKLELRGHALLAHGSAEYRSSFWTSNVLEAFADADSRGLEAALIAAARVAAPYRRCAWRGVAWQQPAAALFSRGPSCPTKGGVRSLEFFGGPGDEGLLICLTKRMMSDQAPQTVVFFRSASADFDQ